MSKYSGRTSSYSHKHAGWEERQPDGPKAVRKVTFVDAQWSDMPVEIESIIKNLWRRYELGNDHYILKSSINDLLESDTDSDLPLIDYLREQGVADDEQIIIHWWW